MKFTLSTTPLVDALALGVINSNVTKYYQKSCIAQLTAEGSELRINLEANSLYTELVLKGSNDSEGSRTIFVDCLLLKQLVNTFDSSTVTLEFADTGLVLHSGKSKFILPKVIDSDDMRLNSPQSVADQPPIKLQTACWKFVKDHQMFALSMSFVNAQYTLAYAGESGDVLVGDFDRSVFAYSKNSNLGATCLLSDTIINLFSSLPEDAIIYKFNESYVIDMQTDAFHYTSEFMPKFGDLAQAYNADIVLGAFNMDAARSIKVKLSTISKFLSQAELLSSSSDDNITMIISNGVLSLADDNVDCQVDVKGDNNIQCNGKFNTSLLKSVISNLDADEVYICPLFEDNGDIGSITAWTEDMAIVLGAIE